MPELRGVMFRTMRFAGVVVPLPLLAALLWPLALVRALVDAALRPDRNPPTSLPPSVPRRRLSPVGVQARTAAWLNTASLIWADRFTSRRWKGRIDVVALEAMRPLLREGPVIAVTVHFGGIFVLPTLLRAHGIPTASVVGQTLWPVRWWRRKRAELTRIGDAPLHLESGDVRGVMQFLVPGRCLVVAADYPFGDQAVTTFDSSPFRASTPPLKLARLTNAAVVPVLVHADGVWRYSLHVGERVPDELIRAGRMEEAVAHIARELLPIAAVRPEQALPLLVKAFRPGPAG